MGTPQQRTVSAQHLTTTVTPEQHANQLYAQIKRLLEESAKLRRPESGSDNAAYADYFTTQAGIDGNVGNLWSQLYDVAQALDTPAWSWFAIALTRDEFRRDAAEAIRKAAEYRRKALADQRAAEIAADLTGESA